MTTSKAVTGRILLIVGMLAAVISTITSAQATTLERMSIDQMTQVSTEIVQARVVSVTPERRNGIIYSRFALTVEQRWKGASSAAISISVPGGKFGGLQQTFPGTPAISVGSEYVFFLWTGKNGITQLVGLSQGVFDYQPSPSATASVVSRPATTATLLADGQPVTDSAVKMTLADLDRTIRQALAKTPAQISAQGAPRR